MIKVEVIEEFTLERFEELKNIVRKEREEEKRLFVEDTFECSKEMADYLLGDNDLNRAVVKIVEVEPEEHKKETEETVKEIIEESKPEKKTTKKTTTKKKERK